MWLVWAGIMQAVMCSVTERPTDVSAVGCRSVYSRKLSCFGGDYRPGGDCHVTGTTNLRRNKCLLSSANIVQPCVCNLNTAVWCRWYTGRTNSPEVLFGFIQYLQAHEPIVGQRPLPISSALYSLSNLNCHSINYARTLCNDNYFF
jgi:hypothetical protein